jgi:hypothetical protein
MRRVLCLILLVLTTGAAYVAAQSPNDLVVVVTGTKQFHQPSCAVVAKAGSNVRVMKRSEAVRKGFTPHDCDPNAVKVYTQPGDNKYHLASCPKLGANHTETTVGEAGKKYWPCPVCHPPIRQRPPA